MGRLMQVIPLPTSFFSSRDGAEITMLVLHYTGTRTSQEALDILSGKSGKEVSAHYTIDEDGAVYQHVPESEKAWHAGISHWRGVDNVNGCSVGIEIVNPGHEFGYRAFPKTQMLAVADLSCAIINRYHILPRNVVGHSDVAPSRKEDPGELFDWPWLALNGVGLWPPFGERSLSNINLLMEGDANERVASMQRRLVKYGYGVPQSGEFCAVTKAVAVAFQRHWRPQDCSGIWDTDCDARLDELLAATASM
jgi:N-acetylmuramoyl-L-alanine amidase